MDTLTIEYRNKIDGLLYIRFDADQVPNEERISLFCHDDPTGRHDRVVSAEEVSKNYIEIKRYMEES
jgi:hypothetical protein